ncbi:MULTISPECIES: HAD family phosphatase [unclassified Streptomyces]|uniref:HAD family hydrolase n=1 Tax=unclassified Streptomyces TaxID=2593676 RepID=UPI002254B743|nr:MULTISPECIES: HAD family phosphatase [unclassified Streptomyces]MCX4881229.1 HAD family phosphatase [Streptomyces sp. NBC_00847]MCX5421276.1 HAD family phosphatase [Streptomyces sp. NBC_00078]
MTDSSNGRPPFGAVLCDVDNVIRSFDSSRLEALERAAGVAEGTTRKVAFAPDAVSPLMLGEITSQEWAEAIAQGLAGLVTEPQTAYELALALLESPFHADDEVVGLLRRARVRVPLVLVSNATTALESDLDSMGLSDLADHVVNSARVGLAKPDPRIYHLAAELAGIRPERCLFVDDSEENLRAAAELGMHGVLFREPADLERALEPLFA